MTTILRAVGFGGLALVVLVAVPTWRPSDRELMRHDLSQVVVAREFTITARRYVFSPARIEVTQGDMVKITLIAEDIPHGFTIDEYRISKRASPGRNVTFEFCADRAGRFVFYCGLTAEEGCRAMRGELIVR